MMVLINLFESRSPALGANPIKKLAFLGVLLLMGFSGFGQAGVTVSAISGNTTEAGGTATFTVVLDSEPTADVTIPLESSNPDEGILGVTEVTFDSSNWNLPQEITVTGVDDSVVDGDVVYFIITGDVISADPDYGIILGSAIANVEVTNTDDDVAGVTVSAISGNTTEAGGTATFTVVLDSEPTADVAIPLESSNPDEGILGVTEVTFDSSNWNLPQEITVTGVDDSVVDGNVTYIIVTGDIVSDDPNYGGMPGSTIADVTVINEDDDTAGFTLSETTLLTTEGGAPESFMVELTTAPLGDVVFTMVSGDTSEGAVSPATLTFTPTNWSDAQEVTVTPVGDGIVDGPQTYTVTVSIDPANSDPNFGSVPAQQVNVTNNDEDSAGFTLSATTLTTVENGSDESFTVVLTAEPLGDVVFTVVSGDTSEGTVSPATLTFTPTNWSDAQEVTVTPVGDGIVDGPQTYTVTVGIDPANSDPNFGSVPAQQLSVTNNDEDSAGFTLSATTLTTVENGSDESFTVVLTAEPLGDVVFTVVSDDTSEGTVSPATLTFTPANWNVPQTVTVTPVDDDIVDGPQNYAITVSVDVAGSDPNFGSVPAQQVGVTNDDDDTYTASITATTPNASENPFAAGVFTIRLNTANTTGSPIVINYNVSGTAVSGVDFDALSGFVSIGNNQQEVTVNIAPINDTEVEPTETVILSLAAGTGYTIGSANEATVNILSDDRASVSININETVNEDVGTVTFTVTLNGATPADFNVSYATVNGTAVSGFLGDYVANSGTLNFAGLDGEIQEITVTINNDIFVEPSEVFFIDLLNVSRPDLVNIGNNRGIVTIIDNDSANVTINDVTVNEGGGAAVFTVTLTGSSLLPFSVDYATSDGTAVAGQDYTATSGTLDFTGGTAGQTRTISVPILDDDIVEQPENFMVTLSNITSILVNLGNTVGTATIVDNDLCPAGTVAPVFNSGVPTSLCDVLNQDLNLYTNSVPPVGTELVWGVDAIDLTDESTHLPNSVVNSDFPGTYYGFFYDRINKCASPALEVTIAFNNSPTITDLMPGERCGEGTVVLGATVEVGNLAWYDAETGGTLLGTGESFTTPPISVTTTYYVESSDGGCISERVPVIATVVQGVQIGNTVNANACNEAGEDNTSIDLDTTRIGEDLAAGVWSIVGTPPGPVTIDANNIVDFVGAPEGEYIFRFTTNTAVAPCTDESVEVTITVGSCSVETIDLGLEKTVDRTDDVIAGDEVVFTITLTNLGQTTFTGIVVDELIDPELGFQYVSHSASKGVYDVDAGVWELEEVVGDEAITLTITATVVGEGTFQNVATLVDSLPGDENPANNTASASVTVGSGPIVDLGLEKTVDRANALEGDQVVFTVTLTNLGPMPVADIRVNELIDPNIGFQYVSHTASAGTYDVVGGVWALEEVLGNGVHTLTITATVVRQGTFQNVVSLVDSLPVDENPDNNTARVSVSVGARSNDECGFMFNQISPNGDGTNDALYINCIDQYPNNSIQIFNRYGNEVFAARGYDNSWMGTGKNGDLPKGTYFYILDLGDGTGVKRGWIQIIR